MILIIGAGIAGLTTAIALQKNGVDFKVLEAVPEIKGVGAGISLAGNAMRVLKALGISELVKARGHLISSMEIQDEKGKAISVMDAQKLSTKYGLENVAIHRGDLHQVLLGQIHPSKIITNKKVVDFEQRADGVIISFEDGTTMSGDAAIVADGIHSLIRQKLVTNSLPRYSGYTCWRGVVENNWNLSKLAVEVWGRSGRFGYVPIGNNQVYWFACKNAPEKSPEHMRWSTVELARNFESFAEPIPSIIKSTSTQQLIWSDIVDIKPINQFAFGNVVLIGDAAHATTPNLGQGACMGIEDAQVLAESIESDTNLTSAFKAFEAKRLKRTHFIVNSSYRLGKIAQLENNFLIALRNGLMRVTPESVNERQVANVLNVKITN